jgi:hypothetical protein
MKTRALLTLAAVAFAVAPIGAQAHHCESKLAIRAYTQGLVDLGPGAFLCILDDGHTAPVDYRIISPGSTNMIVQYLQDISATMPTTVVYLDGIGFDHKQFVMTREPVSAGGQLVGYQYVTSSINLPQGATSSGCLTAAMVLSVDESGVEEFETTSYHTAGTDCPDYP